MIAGKRRRWLGVVLLLTTMLVLLYWQRAAVSLLLVQRGIDEITANADPIAQLDDALYLGICGAGSPMTDERRAGPCTVVIAGKRMFVFDTGAGSAARILRMQLNPAQIDAVFLTHYHSDHIDGLGELLMQRWVGAAAEEPVEVYGPEGLGRVVAGFREAYLQDQSYRTLHHGEDLAPTTGFGAISREFDSPKQGESVILLSDETTEIRAFLVDHGPVKPAVGYRVRYRDRSLVISGDTAFSEELINQAKGADLLLHEAMSMKMVELLERGFDRHGRSRYAQLMRDIRNYHSSPEEAAQVASAAGVGHLVLHHIVPPLPLETLRDEFLGRAESIFSGPIDVSRDGDWYQLPLGSTAIVRSHRP